MPSATHLRKSSVDMDPWENPTTANSRDNKSCLARLYSAGISLRLVKSPAAPKITMTQGSPGRPTRCGCEVGATAVSSMGCILYQSFQRKSLNALRRLLAGYRFHMSAELLTHGGKYLLCESMFLARTEAGEQGCRKHVNGDGFVNRRLNRPATFAGVLHKSAVFGERGIFRQSHRRQIKQP